jgi:hypothetical protein
MENTCSGTFLSHYEFIGSFEAIRRAGRVAQGIDPTEMRRAMSMKTLMSAAHAAGYAMAADDFSEPRAELVRAPRPNAIVVHRASQRGPIANAQRTLRRMWLRAWSADYFGNHRAAA